MFIMGQILNLNLLSHNKKYNILHFQNIDRLSKISQLIFENNVIGIIRGNIIWTSSSRK